MIFERQEDYSSLLHLVTYLHSWQVTNARQAKCKGTSRDAHSLGPGKIRPRKGNPDESFCCDLPCSSSSQNLANLDEQHYTASNSAGVCNQ